MSKRDRVAFEWSMKLMTRTFCDLATSFAAVDSDLADRAMHRIENTIAAELAAFIEKPPEGIASHQVRTAVAQAVAPLRQMTQQARALIQQAGKPKH